MPIPLRPLDPWLPPRPGVRPAPAPAHGSRETREIREKVHPRSGSGESASARMKRIMVTRPDGSRAELPT